MSSVVRETLLAACLNNLNWISDSKVHMADAYCSSPKIMNRHVQIKTCWTLDKFATFTFHSTKRQKESSWIWYSLRATHTRYQKELLLLIFANWIDKPGNTIFLDRFVEKHILKEIMCLGVDWKKVRDFDIKYTLQIPVSQRTIKAKGKYLHSITIFIAWTKSAFT